MTIATGHYKAAEQKASKASVNYTPKAMKRDERCGLCRYYIDGGTCRIVEGAISSEGWCQKFERR